MTVTAPEAPQAPLRVKYVEYESLTQPHRWDAHDVDWHTWAPGITSAPFIHKDSAPLWGLYTLRPGGGRSADDVVEYWGLCLDFDDVPVEAVGETASKLAEAGVSYLWHTTWSHTLPDKGERRRIIVPLTAPIVRDDYRRLMHAVREEYAPALDTHALQRSQAFFVPAHPPHLSELSECFYAPGGGLDPAPLLAQVQQSHLRLVQPTDNAPVRVVDREVWEGLARRWARRTNPRDADTGHRLQRVCEGVRYAAQGERDIATWRLVNTIVRAYPDIATDSVVEFFRQSLDRMAVEDGETAVTEHSLREKVERARCDLLEASQRVDKARAAAIQQAFDSDRTHQYTSDELEDIAQWLGLRHPDELQRRWIYQHERQYYFIAPGAPARIISCQRESFDNLARVALSPAPIDMHLVTKDGRVQMTRAQLLECYSTPVHKVRYSLEHQQPRCVDGVLTLPACPLRPIAPRYDGQIAEWLRLLAGPQHAVLLQWLANLTVLDKPLAALVLTGPASCGKSMLALGLSRLWSVDGPTKLDQAMSAHPTALMGCPFVASDEGEIPRDQRGNERTEDLRSFVQATIRQINPKHRDEVPLEGACRLQISANNDDVLALGGDLSGNDIDAIAARFLHVPASAAAVRYLESLGGRAGTEAWVSGDGIAGHVLWLRDTLGADWQGRFGVPTSQALVDRMLIRGGLRAQVCELCLRALKDPTPLAEGAMVVDGELLIRADWVLESWDTWMRRVRTPLTASLLKALDGIATRVTIEGEGWFLINRTRLYSAGAESGAGSRELIDGWLQGKDVSNEDV